MIESIGAVLLGLALVAVSAFVASRPATVGEGPFSIGAES